MRFGRVDTLGQFISEFDPEPDSSKKRIGNIRTGLSLHLLPISNKLYKFFKLKSILTNF